jgi:ribosomal protein S18 acetylase RimI-like enzyme
MKIESVDIAKEIGAVGDLVRLAFSEVAERLGFTRENSPGFTAFVTDEKLLDQLDRAETRCLGIRADGQLVGFVAVAPYEDEVIVTRLAVRPDLRHRGYGRALMDAACDIAREMGLSEIGLGLVNENAALKRWYLAQGFVTYGEPYHIPGEAYSVCEMVKAL